MNVGRRRAIEARGVSVVYREYVDGVGGFKDRIASGQLRRDTREIHALSELDLIVDQGETLGILGRNGSGKSTTLAAIAGLLPLQSGSIRVTEQPTLLGVTGAMRPALAGWRNIVIAGVALGHRFHEIKSRVDEILEFASLQEVGDLPIHTYSTGMRARLQFAIATSIEPKILLIDEALAVGDEEFKVRSRARIRELRDAASAVVLVSHSLSDFEGMCDRVVWLDQGRIRASGAPGDVVEKYLHHTKVSE
jgi:teichoic acid transport system ATP-binding protein